jgi:hypothetical protein
VDIDISMFVKPLNNTKCNPRQILQVCDMIKSHTFVKGNLILYIQLNLNFVSQVSLPVLNVFIIEKNISRQWSVRPTEVLALKSFLKIVL